MKKTLLFIALLLAVPALAQDNEECIMCHAERDLTMERDGVEISLFVNSAEYDESVHADFACVDCHEDFSPLDLPHREGDNIAEVDCGMCHEVDTFNESIHGLLGTGCYECHSTHAIKPADEFVKKSYNACVSCHQTQSIRNYTRSVHRKAYDQNGNGPTCITCHDQHAHEIQQANFDKQKQLEVCGACHNDFSSNEFAQTIHTHVEDPASPGCINCHGAHQVNTTQFSHSSQGCLTCHMNPDLFDPEDSGHLIDFVETYRTSIHAVSESGEAASCEDCHGNHLEEGLETSRKRVSHANIPETCGACHEKEVEEFYASSHGKVFAEGVDVAPTCTDCHGEHSISPVTSPQFNKLAQKKMCYDCHVENEKVIELTGGMSSDIRQYEQSAHYQALLAGNEAAPTCTDCHTGHMMLKASEPGSSVSKQHISETCGQAAGCHLTAFKEYEESAHYGAILDGNLDSPTCNDCHGNHQIQTALHNESNETENQYISQLCSDCHSSVLLEDKYDLPAYKTESYYDSYHGLAVRGGSKYAANCASCHEHHAVKPATDPTSSIAPENLGKTCGECHPGAVLSGEFKQVHLTETLEESAFLMWIKIIYLIIIVATIGAMALHNILDLYRKFQEQKKHKDEIKKLKSEGKYYIRMTLNERIQHFILLTSFIGLVISGFGLVYPDVFWVEWLRAIFGENAFELRGITHRALGIIMVIISFYHMYYLVGTARGRKLLIDLLPVKQDLTDVIHNVKYLIGLEKHHPKFDRFSYMEKAEYWALVWGTAVMSVTGLMLMYNDYFLANFPKIALDAATLIHFYEAWLATLAIIVWHFYYVIFNPVVYPLNTAAFTGLMSEEVMRKEHPLELEKIERAKRGETSAPEDM